MASVGLPLGLRARVPGVASRLGLLIVVVAVVPEAMGWSLAKLRPHILHLVVGAWPVPVVLLGGVF